MLVRAFLQAHLGLNHFHSIYIGRAFILLITHELAAHMTTLCMHLVHIILNF